MSANALVPEDTKTLQATVTFHNPCKKGKGAPPPVILTAIKLTRNEYGTLTLSAAIEKIQGAAIRSETLSDWVPIALRLDDKSGMIALTHPSRKLPDGKPFRIQVVEYTR